MFPFRYIPYRSQSTWTSKRPADVHPESCSTTICAPAAFLLLLWVLLTSVSAYQIVEGIYTSVITNDIARRHNISNYDLFNRVVKYVVENVGKTFSANAIVKFLRGEGRSLSVESIYNYLNWLEKAFVIYRCQRYDLQGKSVLKTQEKFYLADPSLKILHDGLQP